MEKYWILAAIIGIALILTGCDKGNHDEAAQEAAQLEEERQTKQKIQELCSRYNAVADWKESEPKYTVGMEEALIRTDGRPVLLFTSVEDIDRESEKYTVYLRSGHRLSDFIHQLIGEPERYAVIAQISEVKKVKFELKSYADNPEEVYIELEPSNDFIARGTCLDLLFVGNYIPSTPTGSKKPDMVDFIFRGLGFDIHFILDCTPKQAKKIMLRSADSKENP